jgi:hypothetical protein
VLERVDRSKRFITTAIVLLLLAVLFTYLALLHTAAGGGSASKEAFVAVGAQMVFVGVCAVLIAFHVTRMTKVVLNAIELLRK